MRPTVDLGDQRTPLAAARHEPALDRPAVDLAAPLDRLDQRQLVEHLAIEGRQHPRLGPLIEHPQVRRCRRCRTQIDVSRPAAGRGPIE